ncbi:hypothetical protein B0H19DRAFT_1055410 [Mycena capillaripes]|nr:hypothetical protein B0H19DRAFT_1055410 [Mycena capillaripes]
MPQRRARPTYESKQEKEDEMVILTRRSEESRMKIVKNSLRVARSKATSWDTHQSPCRRGKETIPWKYESKGRHVELIRSDRAGSVHIHRGEPVPEPMKSLTRTQGYKRCGPLRISRRRRALLAGLRRESTGLPAVGASDDTTSKEKTNPEEDARPQEDHSAARRIRLGVHPGKRRIIAEPLGLATKENIV